MQKEQWKKEHLLGCQPCQFKCLDMQCVLNQSWRTSSLQAKCSPHDHLIWPVLEFIFVAKVITQHRIKTKLHEKETSRQ